MLWSYLRARVREAFLAGVAEAVAELEQGDTQILGPAVAELRPRLQALPPPEPKRDKPRRPLRAA
jgi:hypothetical protein